MEKKLIEGNRSFELKDLAVKEYLRLKNSLKKEEFLTLILQRTDKLLWKKKLKENFSNNIISYFAFVQKEIKNNWDLLKNDFGGSEKPGFLTFDSSQTLMVKLIEFFKEKGNLKEILFSDEELAQKMLSNLYSLAAGNVPYSSFSKLIKNQNFNKTLFKDETYENLTRLLEIYLSRTLKLGVFDYPSSLYIFNNYLLENQTYLQSLKRYKQILVTDYSCQIPCINKFLYNFQNVIIFNNPQGAYGIYFPNSKKNEDLTNNYQKTELINSNDFLDKFYKNLFLGQKINLNSDKIKIKKNFQDNKEFFNYLEILLKKAKTKGFQNISILSPARNTVLSNNLEKFCKEENLNFLNLDKNEKFLDNPHLYALCSLGILYFNYGKLYLNGDEFRQILVLLLKFTHFEGAVLGKKMKIEKIFLEKLIKNFPENENIRIFNEIFAGEFLTVGDFYETLLGKKDVFDIKTAEAIEKLSDLSKSFLENIGIFQNIKDKNLEFFISLRKGLKESETLEEINKKMDFQGVSLGTPSSVLKLSREADLTVFIDINNNLWNVNFVNIIQNPFLLNGFFKDRFYDFESDNMLKREELYNLISRIYFSTNQNMVFLGKQNNSTSLLKENL